MSERESVTLTEASVARVRSEDLAGEQTPDISCHKEAAVAAAGMPATHTHPHRCAACGTIFVALNSYDDRPKPAAAPETAAE